MPKPLDPPKVIVGGRELTLKYSLLADYVLDRRGIDTTQILAVLRANKPGRSSLVIELFAACVAHNFVEAGDPVPTAEQWCLRLNTDQLKELGGKLVLAMFPDMPAPVAPVVEAGAQATGTDSQPIQ